MPTLPLLITRQDELDALCDVIAACTMIGLDTEFVRTRTYKPQLGLLQIAAGDIAVCVDPLAGLQDQHLWELLFDPNRSIVMHSATQDLEVMWFHQGGIVRNLIDTQLCAALLGYQPQIGYAGLVSELADVTLSKEQTRTDWTRRPLTAEQLDYAAKDVVYLDGMHTLLKTRLQELDRYEWALEDSAALCEPKLYEPDTENAWQRIKSIPFLPAGPQARARRLAGWREQRAVQLDKPRKWVMDDKALLAVATADPTDLRALADIAEVPGGLARRQGKALLAELAQANQDVRDHPERYLQQTPNRELEGTVRPLLKRVRDKAAGLDIPAEVLASRRDVQALLQGDPGCRLLHGWRHAIIGAELAAAI